ncbi:Uncharacterised protein [BD1-7 clade bacterium]|uniref:DUF4124 domain-containing protein n=1 Tax=BD1-7 clade bacterium TaxID=2029982 RepID=A0A5S9QEA3_9GAMM|nr:Uncharacterised protein [BD1-7 clade bacterium]
MAKKGFSPIRLVIKVCIVLIIPLVLMSTLPGPSGEPVINMNTINPVSLGKDAVTTSQSWLTRAWVSMKQWWNNDTITGRQKVMVYRWQDKHGNLQFSQRHPGPGINAELVEITDRSLSMPKPDQKLSKILNSYQEQKNGDAKEQTTSRSANPLTLDGASTKKLINDAKQVQTLMNKRAEQQAQY